MLSSHTDATKENEILNLKKLETAIEPETGLISVLIVKVESKNFKYRVN